MAKNRDLSVSDLSKFIAKEAYKEKYQVERVIDGDTEEAIVTGDAVGPLKLIGKEGHNYILRAHKAYFSRFRSGDRIELAEINEQTKKFKKIKDTTIRMVRFPKPGVLEVLVPSDEFILKPAQEVFLLPTSFAKLKWVIRQKLQDIESSGVKAEHHTIDKTPVLNSFNRVTEKLNSTQKEALKFLVDNDFHGLVQGPPGTGKTHLLVDLIRLGIENNIRIGLASLTHTAVDNALARVLKAGIHPSKLLRITGNKQKINTKAYKGFNLDEVLGGSFRKISAQSEFEDIDDILLYAATLHSWCLTQHPPDIDILIIDEASQVPIYFYPFLEALCSRVIMFGDHRQLPPVVQVTHHNLPAEDIFTYEIERGIFPMLETQYRMNEGIQEWSSNRFYQGRLQPDEAVRNRDIIKGKETYSHSFGTKFVNLIHHSGRSYNNTNSFEASKIADLIWALKAEGSLLLKDIGIVTPYRSQAGAISAHLQEKLGLSDMQKILVDTVEKFQGQEKEVMILSLGTDKDRSCKGDHGFLGDGRRLNVSVTRARSRFYCFSSNKLIYNTKRQKNAEHLNSFLKWCEAYDDSENSEESA